MHISNKADLSAHFLDIDGNKMGVTCVMDTGTVVVVTPFKIWESKDFTRANLIPANTTLSAASGAAFYATGRISL